MCPMWEMRVDRTMPVSSTRIDTGGPPMTMIEDRTAPAAAGVDELRSAVRGEVFAPGDAGYDEAAKIWNGAHDASRPALVIRCSGPADVIAALAFARSGGLEIAVRGGGHSIAGF